MDKLSIYIPKGKMKLKPIERIQELAEKYDRSVNYMVVQAILDYVDRLEKLEDVKSFRKGRRIKDNTGGGKKGR